MDTNVSAERLPSEDKRTLFRDLSNAWARGVAVVTTVDPSGRPYGLTMRAVSPVSADPLRFMICVGEASRSLKAILAAQSFCINYLGAAQSEIAEHFASRKDDKFATVKHTVLESGAIAIDGATTTIECRVSHAISSGDHRLLVGDVLRATVRGGDPLLIFGGAYGRIAAN